MKGFGIDATGGMEGHWITGRKRMGFYLGECILTDPYVDLSLFECMAFIYTNNRCDYKYSM